MSFRKKYILNDAGQPVACADIKKWKQFFTKESDRCLVKEEDIGGSRIATVFLCEDYSHGNGPPILWETLVIGGKLDKTKSRCTGNREQAEAMHKQMVEKVRKVECR